MTPGCLALRQPGPLQASIRLPRAQPGSCPRLAGVAAAGADKELRVGAAWTAPRGAAPTPAAPGRGVGAWGCGPGPRIRGIGMLSQAGVFLPPPTKASREHPGPTAAHRSPGHVHAPRLAGCFLPGTRPRARAPARPRAAPCPARLVLPAPHRRRHRYEAPRPPRLRVAPRRGAPSVTECPPQSDASSVRLSRIEWRTRRGQELRVASLSADGAGTEHGDSTWDEATGRRHGDGSRSLSTYRRRGFR